MTTEPQPPPQLSTVSITELEGRVAVVITLNRPEVLNAWNGDAGPGPGPCPGLDRGRGPGRCGGDHRGGTGLLRRRRPQRRRPTPSPTGAADDPGDDDTESQDARPPFPGTSPSRWWPPSTATPSGSVPPTPWPATSGWSPPRPRSGSSSPAGACCPSWPPMRVLPRVVGFSNAADLLIRVVEPVGRRRGRGHRPGLGWRSPADEVVAEAVRRAEEMAVNALPRCRWPSPRACCGSRSASESMMAREQRPLFAWVANQPDSVEGVESFLEKRDPAWKPVGLTGLPPGQLLRASAPWSRRPGRLGDGPMEIGLMSLGDLLPHPTHRAAGPPRASDTGRWSSRRCRPRSSGFTSVHLG